MFIELNEVIASDGRARKPSVPVLLMTMFCPGRTAPPRFDLKGLFTLTLLRVEMTPLDGLSRGRERRTFYVPPARPALGISTKRCRHDARSPLAGTIGPSLSRLPTLCLEACQDRSRHSPCRNTSAHGWISCREAQCSFPRVYQSVRWTR